MALYSFCIKRKNGEYETYSKPRIGTAKTKNDLEVLDALTMQFNTKQELMNYLGIDPKKYDDIAITYQMNKRIRRIPVILSDAPELEDVAFKQIGFHPSLDGCDLSTKLAETYHYSSNTKITLDPSKSLGWGGDRIYNAINGQSRVDEAYDSRALHKTAYDDFNDNWELAFANGIFKSYLSTRKIYLFLRKRGYLSAHPQNKAIPFGTLKDAIMGCRESAHDRIMAAIPTYIDSYEEYLVGKILNGDNDALEELMAFPAEKLQRYQTFLNLLNSYYAERRRSQRRFEKVEQLSFLDENKDQNN